MPIPGDKTNLLMTDSQRREMADAIATEFNTVFISAFLTASNGLGSAQWSTTTWPKAGGDTRPPHSQLGPKDEKTSYTGSEIAYKTENNVLSAVTVFNALHSMAMSYTRVRNATFYYYTSSPPVKLETSGTGLTALADHMAVHFPIPDIEQFFPASERGKRPFNAGLTVYDVNLTGFINALVDEVDKIRSGVTDPNQPVASKTQVYNHNFLQACHSSCHSSCHGSRGRR